MAKKSKKKHGKSGKAATSRTTQRAAVPAQRSPYVAVIADRRRTKLRATREAAQATAELAGLEEQLDVSDAQLRALEVRRERAEQQLLELHNSIGAAQLTRARIRSDRKRARSRASAAQDRATAAERHYDSAVLAQLVEADLGVQDDAAVQVAGV